MASPRTSIVLAAAVAAGCGSSSPGGPAPARAAPAAIATPRSGPDDLPVATVNGRAVWASCVAAQARAMAPGARAASDAERRAAALDQCIAFELLAQAADARGLAGAPEVADATRAAEVNRLVETEFEQRYRAPADLAAQLEAVLKANENRMHVPELRASSYARFVVAKGASPEDDAKARGLAERLAAELAGQTGLFPVHLADAARRIGDGSGVKLDTADFHLAARRGLVDSYAAALFALPEVGRTSPAFRTQWGWDVVLWTDGVAAHERSRDEMSAEIFPELRRRQFLRWANDVARQLGVHVEVDQAAVARLDQEGAP